MATKKRKSTSKPRPAGVKANGTLKKGYRWKKGGGGTVKTKK